MSYQAKRWAAVGLLCVGVVGANFGIIVYFAAHLPDTRQAERIPSIEELVDQLAAPDAAQRRTAAKQLGDRGFESQPALPRLRQMLDDEDRRVRFTAATALWSIDRQAEPMLLALWEAWGKNLGNCELEHGIATIDPEVGQAYLEIKGSLFLWPRLELTLWGLRAQPPTDGAKEKVEQAVMALAQGLQHEHYGVRRMAIFMLPTKTETETARVAVPELTRATADEDLWVRIIAISMLGEIGPPARQAVAVLHALVESGMRRRASAIGALYATAQCNPILVPLFAERIDLEFRVGEAAAKSLNQIDPEMANAARMP